MTDRQKAKLVLQLNQYQSELEHGNTPQKSRAGRDYLLDYLRMHRVNAVLENNNRWRLVREEIAS